MTQSQIDRLRECKKKADEIKYELIDIFSEMAHCNSENQDYEKNIKDIAEVQQAHQSTVLLSYRLNNLT
jgi:hypothetical protein